MIVIFDLIRSGVVSDPNNITDINGNPLSSDTITTILALIATRYVKSEYETVFIDSKYFNNITTEYKKYLDFLSEQDIINIITNDTSTSYQFSNNFKKFAVVSDIITDKFDDKQEKIQNQTIPIIKNTDQRLFKDLYDIEVIYKPIKKQILIEPDIYDFKSYLLSFFNFKRIANGDIYYNWKEGQLYTPFSYCSKEVKLTNFNVDEDNLSSLKIPSSYPLFLAVWCIIMGIDKNDYDFKEWCSLVKKGNDKNNKSKFYKEFRKKLDKIKDSDGDEISYEDVNIVSKKERKHFSHVEAIKEFKKWISLKIKDGDDLDDITNNVFKLNYPLVSEITDRKRYNIYQEIINLQMDFMVNKMASKLYEEIEGIKLLISHDEIYFQNRFSSNVNKIWQDGLNELYNILPDSDEIDDENINYEDLGIFTGWL
jgi:hypothetical protein